jgi:hypothetical protein
MTAQNDEGSAGRAPTLRFVHCSDLHLDAPFAAGDDTVRRRLAEEARATLHRLAELCLAERPAALLIAGDLFDDERLSLHTEELLLSELSRVAQAGVPVVLACGNHDHAGPGGRSSALAWPEGVHVAGNEPLAVDLRDEQGRTVGRVFAVGHVSAHETGSLLSALPAVEEGVPSVVVLHGRVEGARGAWRHEALAPCGPEDFAASGHRYWALGHVHERQQVGRKPAAHYPGSLLAHGFDEPGARGALLVTLPPKGEAKVEFRPLSLLRFETPALPGLPAMRDLTELRAACVAAFEALREQDGRAETLWMLRFELSGPCAAAADCQRDELLDELSDELTTALSSFGVLRVAVQDAGVTRPVDLSPHAGQPHLLGEALAVAAALQDDAVLDRVLPVSLAGVAPGADKRAYVRALLQDIERAAAEALLREVRP